MVKTMTNQMTITRTNQVGMMITTHWTITVVPCTVSWKEVPLVSCSYDSEKKNNIWLK